MKPRNKTATNPLLKKGHAHKSAKDYDRKKARQATKKEVNEALKPSRQNNKDHAE